MKNRHVTVNLLEKEELEDADISVEKRIVREETNRLDISICLDIYLIYGGKYGNLNGKRCNDGNG